MMFDEYDNNVDRFFKILSFSFLFFCGVGIIIAIIVPIFPILAIQTIDNGSHTGIVTAIETSGIIFKPTLVYFKTSDESTQEDVYVVIDENVKKQLNTYQQQKKVITIIYDSYLFQGYNYGISPIIVGVV